MAVILAHLRRSRVSRSTMGCRGGNAIQARPRQWLTDLHRWLGIRRARLFVAGQFLAGTFGSLHTHRENASVAGIGMLGAAIAAVPVWWPGSPVLAECRAGELAVVRPAHHADRVAAAASAYRFTSNRWRPSNQVCERRRQSAIS